MTIMILLVNYKNLAFNLLLIFQSTIQCPSGMKTERVQTFGFVILHYSVLTLYNVQDLLLTSFSNVHHYMYLQIPIHPSHFREPMLQHALAVEVAGTYSVIK